MRFSIIYPHVGKLNIFRSLIMKREFLNYGLLCVFSKKKIQESPPDGRKSGEGEGKRSRTKKL